MINQFFIYKTPLNQNDFKATIVKVATTDFKENNKKSLYYALAIVLGGMIGIVYVLISNAFRDRKMTQLVHKTLSSS